MEEFSAGPARDAHRFGRDAMDGSGANVDPRWGDDPLGDEAAFPTSWQQLDAVDASDD